MIVKVGGEPILIGKMSRADRERHRSCLIKVPYRTESRARKVARRVSKRSGEDIRHYKCLHCAGWHCGHPRKPKVDAAASSGDNTQAVDAKAETC